MTYAAARVSQYMVKVEGRRDVEAAKRPLEVERSRRKVLAIAGLTRLATARYSLHSV